MTTEQARPEPQARALAPAEVEQLIKSKRRVRSFGEVFTPQHMVNQMLDLVRPELETGPRFVDKTFLEPAAGDGNFLVTILRRKLAAIEHRYQPEFWPTESLFALASIYGVELLPDNNAVAKARMLTEFTDFHRRHGTACGQRTNLSRAAHYLVAANVVCGNFLTQVDHAGRPIELSWWHRVLNVPGTVRRETFTLSSLRGEGAGMLSFDVPQTYAPCRIDHVHQGA